VEISYQIYIFKFVEFSFKFIKENKGERSRLIECTLQVESAGAQAICQAHQSKPHYCQIATPACYYAILSAKQ
jgi:hypothetical protein